MKAKISMFIVLAAFSIASQAETQCNSSVTPEIEACAKRNFESSDSELNSFYRVFASKLSGKDRETLQGAQRGWIKYKEEACQGAFDATSPGQEAGAEKWGCLNQITRSRIRELRYLDSDIDTGDFSQALLVMSRLYEGGDMDKVIDKLVQKKSGVEDPNWISYVDLNCELATARVHEEKRECIARQSFYRY